MHHFGGLIDAHVGLGLSNGANKLVVESGHLSESDPLKTPQQGSNDKNGCLGLGCLGLGSA